MRRAATVRIGAMLLTGIVGAGATGATGALAQTQPNPPAKTPPLDVRVTGQRLPAAEAPKWATCESLALDPYTRRIIELFPEVVLQPTRLPRNPDYTKPPLVPPGSPLPTLGRARFGAVGGVVSENAALDPAAGDPDPTADAVEAGETGFDNGADSYDQARIACRLRYSRGFLGVQAGSGAMASAMRAMLGGDMSRLAGLTEQRMAVTRAQIAARDTTLPMAFALFDQGRYAESLVWFERAFNKLDENSGGDEAALFVGKLYLQGLGERCDTPTAIKWLKRAATSPFNPRGGTPVFDPKQPTRNTAIGEAAVILGNIHASGFGGAAKDLGEARRWYQRAYDVGHIAAAATVADMYRDGLGGEQDLRKAAMWYKRAARFGVASAQVGLANLLDTGASGVKRNRKMALGWYRAAAKNDHPDALYALAHAFDFGLGIKADPQLALGLYKNAALKGSAEAKTALGTHFHEGKLVPRDDAVARKWFASAAVADEPDAMYRLAALLANGQGGTRDLPAAWTLLRQASARGHAEAGAAMVAVEGRMTAAQRAAAHAGAAVP